MSISDLVSIRELRKEDLNFIMSSFIACLSKYTESIVKGQPTQISYDYLEKILLCSLTQMTYSVFIACNKDDSDNIIGYVVADTETNHILFNYTKYNYRKLGIQQNLLLPLVVDPDKPITVNWPTKEMLKLSQSNPNVTIQNKFVESLIERIS